MDERIEISDELKIFKVNSKLIEDGPWSNLLNNFSETYSEVKSITAWVIFMNKKQREYLFNIHTDKDNRDKLYTYLALLKMALDESGRVNTEFETSSKTIQEVATKIRTSLTLLHMKELGLVEDSERAEDDNDWKYRLTDPVGKEYAMGLGIRYAIDKYFRETFDNKDLK